MKIKKSHLSLAIVALIAVSSIGMASATLAAGKNNTVGNRTISSNTEHFGRGKGAGSKLTEVEREVKHSAVEAALKANDYNAWVKAVGVNAPILEKITTTNFSRYVELYKLREQEKNIMTELGLEGNGKGMGMGRGMGLGLGLGQK